MPGVHLPEKARVACFQGEREVHKWSSRTAPLSNAGFGESVDTMEARLVAIVTNSDDAIVSKDLTGIVQSWNEAATRIFGYTAEEMVGKSITILVPPERSEEEPAILARLCAGERVDHFETVRVTKDGRRIEVSVTISPIVNRDGTIVGASKIARDITLMKQVTREREELLESERAARQEAERVGRVKDEFLATLSHELRSPLSAILGWAQLLRAREVAPEDLGVGLETIERNARAQSRLIEELLDMSRIVSGMLRLDVQTVDLPAVISDAVESVRPASEAKEIRIHVVQNPNAAPITGDPTRVQQIIWNLLTNAIKFTPRGGHIQVVVRRTDSYVEITIHDTGQGISPAVLPRLFTRFSQGDSSTTRRHGGLGLGLALVRHLTELHGGTVRASSPGQGQGATFVVELPITVAKQDARERPTARGASSAPPTAPWQLDLSGIKVLVVDDDPDALALMKRVLESNKAVVVTADTAEAALELLQADKPSILLSDIGMPGQDGYQLIRKVRQLPASQGGDTPAVALTAFAQTEDRRRALLAGFQMHLPKPVEAPELVAVVSSMSRLRR
jgi:PAS domain S-box-containing protein